MNTSILRLTCLATLGLATAALADGDVAWRVTSAGIPSDFPPALAADGTIYTNNGNAVTAVAPDGTVRWSVPASTRKGPVSVGPDGTVYAASADDRILALHPADGSLAWSFDDAGGFIVGGPNVGPDGNVYAVGDSDTGGIGMFSLTSSGTLRWSDTGDPAIADDEGNGHRIHFAGGRAIVAMVPDTGNSPPFNWAYELDGDPAYVLGNGCAGEVTVGAGGELAAGNGLCQSILRLDPTDGSELWSIDAPSNSPCSGMASVAVGPDGAMYTAFCYRAFWAVDASGGQKWFIDDFSTYFWMDFFGVAPDNSVVLDLGRNGTGWVRAFDTATGALQWQLDLPAENGQGVWSTTDPVFDAARNRVYFNARRSVDTSALYAIDLAPPAMPGDANGDLRVDVDDLTAVITAWGPCGDCPQDLNNDGMVGVDDLVMVITNWS